MGQSTGGGVINAKSNKLYFTLNISEQTIKNHITSILRKLDANARTQAVVTAIRRGLITLTPVVPEK